MTKRLAIVAATVLLGAGVYCDTQTGEPGSLLIKAEWSGCVGPGGTATLAASGEGVVSFRWSAERWPAETSRPTLDNPTSPTPTTSPLAGEGAEYSFRVVGTDIGGRADSAWVTVTVEGAPGASGDFCVEIEGPETITTGEAETYIATADQEGTFTYLWESVVNVSTNGVTSNGTALEEEVASNGIMFEMPDASETDATAMTAGEHTIRVTVTDTTTGEVGVGRVTVTAEDQAVITKSSPLLKVGDEMTLTAAPPANSEGMEIRYLWSLGGGPGELNASPPGPEAKLTATGAGTITVDVELVIVSAEGTERISGEAVVVTYAATDANPRPAVEVEVDYFGKFRIALEAAAAPKTVANFLQYVDETFYDGTVLHRVQLTAPRVIQGGGFAVEGAGLVRKEGARDPVESEAPNGLTNEIYTVAMALAGDVADTNGVAKDDSDTNGLDADSADTQFIINMFDHPESDTGSAPRTVFGKVTSGTDVLERIMGEVATGVRSGVGGHVPVEDVVITTIRRADVLSVSISGADTGLVDERFELTATAANAIGSVSYSWRVVSGSADLDDSTESTVGVTPTAAGDLEIKVTATDADSNERAEATKTLTIEEPQVEPATEVVIDVADFGEIVLAMKTEEAPETVANFLEYVNNGFYDGMVFHRVISGFVIQAGGYEPGDDGLVKKDAPRPPVASEAPNGLSNVRGTVAMALRGTDADSGDTQFFINLDDNSDSLDEGPPPFTVFAEVIEGMDVVDEIAAVATGSSGGMSDVPVDDVIITTIRTRETSTEAKP